ncbi:MAG: hypothetical protein ACK5L3_00240 [Oscillospiraceae bacterium]
MKKSAAQWHKKKALPDFSDSALAVLPILLYLLRNVKLIYFYISNGLYARLLVAGQTAAVTKNKAGLKAAAGRTQQAVAAVVAAPHTPSCVLTAESL